MRFDDFFLLFLFQVMRLCWATNPDDRPPFRQLKEELMEIAQTLQMD